jgi:amidase
MGWLWFDEAVTPATVAGTVLIVIGCWIATREKAPAVPAASLPSGLTADGLPLGLQVIAPPRSEFALLQLAAAWHEAFAPARAASPLLG